MGNATFKMDMGDFRKYAAGFNFRCYHQSNRHLYFQGRLFDDRCYGTYHDQLCIVKAKRAYSPMSSSSWDKDISRLKCAEELSVNFQKFHPGVHICFNKLYPVEMDQTSRLGSFVFGSGRSIKEYEWVLVSLYMKEVEHLTLNNPYKYEILSAFSHFTWHYTNGELVLTDFKGQIRTGCKGFDLLLPAIHSKKMFYGDKDKGEEGIKRFFTTHLCTRLCQFLSHPIYR